jgi:acyl carrier protein
MNIKERVIDIMSQNSDMDNSKEYLSNNDDLTKLGINSISFIKLIVQFENEFDIEFEDEEWITVNFSSLNQLCEYIESKLA